MSVERLLAADATLASIDVKPFHLPFGNLAPVVAGALEGLGKGHWWVPGLRERVGAVLRNVPVERLGDGFAGARPYKVAPPTAAPALRALHAVGLALGDRKPVLVHLGIGSASDGAFYEALNLAALHQAPVIFLVAVHPLDGDAPLSQQVATSPHRIAEALGIAVDRVDANTNAVRDAVRDACARNAPTLIEAQLPGATPS